MKTRGTTSIWASRLVRSLAGQWGTSGDPTVMRSLGQFVPLNRPAPQARPALGGDDRADLLLEWSRSGRLSYGDAELLLALDESTPWRRVTPPPGTRPSGRG